MIKKTSKTFNTGQLLTLSLQLERRDLEGDQYLQIAETKRNDEQLSKTLAVYCQAQLFFALLTFKIENEI